ncbi:MAG: M50 family metallopeptidase [Actinomycetota bacterium]
MAFGLSIVLFVVAMFAIVMIHEGGHYLAARRFNFRVLEYFLGFGPKLWSFRRGEIEYGVKAIPAGGYVKIAGMNPFENDVPEGDEHRAYTARPVWQRVTVILAGPFSHFVVAYCIFAAVFFFSANWSIPGIAAVEPLINGRPSPAAVAGLQPGDVVLQIGDLSQPNLGEVGDYQAAHVGEPIVYVVDRDGQELSLTATPVQTQTDGVKGARIGIQMAGVKEGPIGALEHAGGSLWDTTREAVTGITKVFGPSGFQRTYSQLFTGAPRSTDGGVSLIAVGQAAGHAGSQGAWAWYFTLFATVVLFIGLINLLPFPPLDGGHVAIAVIEKIRGKRIDMKKVVPVSAVVLLILGFFSVSAMILDVWKPIPNGP